MQEWFAMNPYELRAKGVSDKLSKHEFGRVLYHMSQRRGKAMNNLNQTTKTLFEGLPNVNRLGFRETSVHLENQFLGSYLNDLLPKKNQPYSYKVVRVRNRYLDRHMYFKEIQSLLKVQKGYHKFIDESFKNTLIGHDGKKGILFFQRPSQYRKLRGVASTCLYEKNKKSMWQSHPLYEWYNIYCWIDSILLYGKPLDENQRQKAIKVAVHFSGFLFKKVRVALGIEDVFAFNYEDSTKIFLAQTISNLARKTAFGKRFLDFTDEEQHELWHDLHYYTDKALLKERLKNRWDLSLTNAAVVAGIKLKPGFGRLSMKAVRTILHYLRQGYPVKNAIILGGITNATGTKRWNSLSDTVRENIIYFVDAAIEEGKIEDPEWVSDFANVFDFQLNVQKLYMIEHFSENDNLPNSPDDDREIIRKFKPVAQKPVFELRKLINKLKQEYGTIDQINFVLSRDVKSNAKHRKGLSISKKNQRTRIT